MARPATLQVGEVAKKAGVSVRTVRYYEELGLLQPAVRTSGGTRLYGDAEVVRLRFVRRLKALGLDLDEIRAALGTGQTLDNREAKVARTLEVLRLEQRRAEEQLAALALLKAEVEHALANVEGCVSCTATACPETCPRQAYLL